MKISQKFLLFGVIIAGAQAIVCVALYVLLSDVEKYAQKDEHQALVARKLVLVMSRTVEVAVAAASYAADPLDPVSQQLDRATNNANAVFSELQQLTMDDPQTHNEIQQLVMIGAASRNDFFRTRGVANHEEPPILAEDSPVKNIEWDKLQVGRRFMERARKINAILARQSKDLEATKLKEQEAREQVRYWILAEAILIFICLPASYIWFRNDFGRRFNNLLIIAEELALDRTPSRSVGGRDELNELSRALAVAAEARQEAVAEKQMLFQMVTHDLRSPLMAAALVVDTLLRDEKSTPEKRQNRLQSVERSLQRVVGLANDLLTIERLSGGGLEINRTRVDFKETVDHAIESVIALAEQGQISLINLCPSLPVSVDEDRILQVTINLISNAIKFSPPGESVEIRASVDGNRLRVEISDRGPGISDKDMKRLFNPFQQVSAGDKAKGFGLGLTIAKMLVELHDGKIGVTARPGGGTTFWYIIRLA